METQNLKVIGRNIRLVRQITGVSQEAIAVKLNVSQAAYSKMENGIISLTEERLKIISSELNISDKALRSMNFNDVVKGIQNR